MSNFLEEAVDTRRLTDSISLGVLAEIAPRDLIEEILDETGKREQRSRLLPAHVVVRFCQAMCLFFDDDYEEVMRKLVGSLEDMRSWSGSWQVPSVSAISQARIRLGPHPMRELFERIAVPLAEPGTKSAWLGHRRIMAIDGFVLDTPDTPKNRDKYGIDGPEASQHPYPQVRVVGLVECGTHAIIDAAFAGTGTGEQVLMPDLLRSVEPDMLIIADRGFYGYDLWDQALDTGAALLWRVKSHIRLPVVRELGDGSFLSVIFPARTAQARRTSIIDTVRNGEQPHPAQAKAVRVIEYTIPNRGGADETIRLITSIIDLDEAAAIELAAAYHERWEIENTFDEMKTHQRGPARVLRSKSPDLVEQEVWSFLLTHYAIRALMTRAADEADVDPDRISFMRSLRVVRRHVTGQADFSP
jgi:hypothetical protein